MQKSSLIFIRPAFNPVTICAVLELSYVSLYDCTLCKPGPPSIHQIKVPADVASHEMGSKSERSENSWIIIVLT